MISFAEIAIVWLHGSQFGKIQHTFSKCLSHSCRPTQPLTEQVFKRIVSTHLSPLCPDGKISFSERCLFFLSVKLFCQLDERAFVVNRQICPDAIHLADKQSLLLSCETRPLRREIVCLAKEDFPPLRGICVLV